MIAHNFRVLSLSSLKGSFVHTPRTLRMVWRSSPRASAALGALTLLAALVPLAVAWVGKAIMDSVVAKDGSATLRWVLVELGLIAGQALIQRGLGLVRSLIG